MIISKYVTFTSPVNVSVKLLKAEDRDPVEAYKDACDMADRDGVKCRNDEIPEKYLKAAGVRVQDISFYNINVCVLGERNAKLTLCRCEQCSAYDAGSCFKYGGLVDGLSTSVDVDCIHGTCGKFLCFNGEKVVSYAFETKLTPEETVEFLKATEDPELIPLKDHLMEFLEEMEEEEIGSGKWSFETDNF